MKLCGIREHYLQSSFPENLLLLLHSEARNALWCEKNFKLCSKFVSSMNILKNIRYLVLIKDGYSEHVAQV